MTKKWLLLCFVTQLIHNMETDKTPINSWDIIHHKTKINLTTESLSNIYTKANLTIIGYNAQRKLLRKNKVVPKSKRISSTDDIIHPNDIGKTSVTHYIIFPDGTLIASPVRNTRLLQIVEPCIKQRCWSDGKKHPSYKTLYGYWTDKAALECASKDLAKCYDIVLTKGSEKLLPKKKKIAIPTLSTKVGFPQDKAVPIAVEQVIRFIEAHPEIYDAIYLVVEDMVEFDLYKSLLTQHTKLLHKISLFYWANQDKNNILSWLPGELIYYIVKLI